MIPNDPEITSKSKFWNQSMQFPESINSTQPPCRNSISEINSKNNFPFQKHVALPVTEKQKSTSGRMCFWISPSVSPQLPSCNAGLSSRRKRGKSRADGKIAGVKITFSDADGVAGKSRLRGSYGPLVPNISALGHSFLRLNKCGKQRSRAGSACANCTRSPAREFDERPEGV